MQFELSPDYHGPLAEPTVAVGRETLGGGLLCNSTKGCLTESGETGARLIWEWDATEMAVVWVQGDPG